MCRSSSAPPMLAGLPNWEQHGTMLIMMQLALLLIAHRHAATS